MFGVILLFSLNFSGISLNHITTYSIRICLVVHLQYENKFLYIRIQNRNITTTKKMVQDLSDQLVYKLEIFTKFTRFTVTIRLLYYMMSRLS